MTKKADDQKAARNSIQVALRDAAEQPDDAVARTLTRPEIQAAAVIQELHRDNHEVNAVAREITAQVAAVHAGDMRRVEAMLVAQAHTLDQIFGTLLRRGVKYVDANYPQAAERYLRLAFKAQAQCRVTLDSLAEIKNPRPVAFVRQANIAHGLQQVNNGNVPAAGPRAHAEKSANPSNELLECNDGERVDSRATGAASGANQELATVGALDGSKD
jgi:hypothetical protein